MPDVGRSEYQSPLKSPTYPDGSVIISQVPPEGDRYSVIVPEQYILFISAANACFQGPDLLQISDSNESFIQDRDLEPEKKRFDVRGTPDVVALFEKVFVGMVDAASAEIAAAKKS